jgi:hypothetical protein
MCRFNSILQLLSSVFPLSILALVQFREALQALEKTVERLRNGHPIGSDSDTESSLQASSELPFPFLPAYEVGTKHTRDSFFSITHLTLRARQNHVPTLTATFCCPGGGSA